MKWWQFWKWFKKSENSKHIELPIQEYEIDDSLKNKV